MGFFVFVWFLTRNLNIMNYQHSSAVGFHLLNEMPLFSIF